jgi:hypothetical protein
MRLLVVLLVVGLAGGSSVLDGCLFRCHAESSPASAVPSCHHAAPASSALSIAGVAGCDHDHDGIWADLVVSSGATPVGHSLAVGASARSARFALAAPTLRSVFRGRSSPVPPSTRRLPLRL